MAVSGSTRWTRPPSATSRHAISGVVTDPAIIRATLRVQDREGYWWVECSMCACCWQTPHYAAESVG
jgi:hypothetical protein